MCVEYFGAKSNKMEKGVLLLKLGSLLIVGHYTFRRGESERGLLLQIQNTGKRLSNQEFIEQGLNCNNQKYF